MRLEQITLPYLQSDMTVKDFSYKIGLTSSGVSKIIIRDLNNVYYKLYKDSDFDLKRVPRTIQDRQKWEKRINEYIEIINLSEKN